MLNQTPSFAMYADLRIDVKSGVLSVTDANDIAQKRLKLECGMEEEEHRIDSYERRVRRQLGTNAATKGLGHRTLGAKTHGKAMIGLAGAGYGRYSSERLARVLGGIALQGKSNHRPC